jgi:hypothetical protein
MTFNFSKLSSLGGYDIKCYAITKQTKEKILIAEFASIGIDIQHTCFGSKQIKWVLRQGKVDMAAIVLFNELSGIPDKQAIPAFSATFTAEQEKTYDMSDLYTHNATRIAVIECDLTLTLCRVEHYSIDNMTGRLIHRWEGVAEELDYKTDDEVEFTFKDGRVVVINTRKPHEVVDFIVKNMDNLKTTQFTPQRKPFCGS